MRAAEELGRLQRAYPPPGADRCRELATGITPEFRSLLADPAAIDQVTFGEVGRTEPNAYSKHFRDCSQFVVAFSGLLDFFQAVAEALCGAARVFEERQQEVAPARDIDDVSERIARLYDAWKSGALWQGKRLVPQAADLPPLAQQHADTISKAMGMFVVAHELGHVVQFLATPAADQSEQWHQTLAQEAEADEQAVRMMFGYGLRRSTRTSLAGVAVALRILTGLEKLGHRFPEDHPPPNARLSQMWAVIREQCLFESKFWYLTTMVFAQDELMEVAENIALGLGRKSSLTSERMFSRAVSVVEEVVKQRLLKAQAVKVITYDFKAADLEMRRGFARYAVRVLRLLPTTSILQDGAITRQKVARHFWQIVPELPPALRRMLKAEKENFETEAKDGDYWMP